MEFLAENVIFRGTVGFNVIVIKNVKNARKRDSEFPEVETLTLFMGCTRKQV